jgi:hypothetical protein
VETPPAFRNPPDRGEVAPAIDRPGFFNSHRRDVAQRKKLRKLGDIDRKSRASSRVSRFIVMRRPRSSSKYT